jgi:hypothetical protein
MSSILAGQLRPYHLDLHCNLNDRFVILPHHQSSNEADNCGYSPQKLCSSKSSLGRAGTPAVQLFQFCFLRQCCAQGERVQRASSNTRF